MPGEEVLDGEDYSDGGKAEAGAPPEDGSEMGMGPKGEVAEGGDAEVGGKGEKDYDQNVEEGDIVFGVNYSLKACILDGENKIEFNFTIQNYKPKR